MRTLLLAVLMLIPAVADAEPLRPAAGSGFAISLSDPVLLPMPGIGVYELDLFEVDPSTVEALHDAGGYVICYFSAGSFEDWRPDVDRFAKDVIGKAYQGWPGEYWLDIRRREILAPIMEVRLDLAVAKNCDAVDPDNVDGFTNDTGFGLSIADQLAFNRWLAEAAHARGLAIGLKNAAELVAELAESYDFSVVESCAAQGSCDAYRPFADRGKAVFQIEYRNETSDWPSACREAKARGFTAVLSNLELDGNAEGCP